MLNTSKFFRWATKAESAVWATAFMFSMSYIALPIYLDVGNSFDSAYSKLASIAAWGVGFIFIGRIVPIFDIAWFPRQRVNRPILMGVLWMLFIGFALLAWLTASEVPAVAMLRGASTDQLAELREAFLKGRGGWQSAFVYVNGALSGALIPYCVAIMFLKRIKYRWIVLGFFVVYSISYLEKAFFLKAIAPLFYLLCQRKIIWGIKPLHLVLITAGLLIGLTVISMSTAQVGGGGNFFTASYVASGPLDQFLWRSIGVPLFSALDAIRTYETFFSRPLDGATSSLLSALTGAERIPFEQLVFGFEWGQLSGGTGSANSVYLTEAYVNFGWWGVVLFSILVGLILRLFATSRDEGFRALWPLFVLNIYSAGLIGTLFSNGFLLAILVATLTDFGGVQRAKRLKPGAGAVRHPPSSDSRSRGFSGRPGTQLNVEKVNVDGAGSL